MCAMARAHLPHTPLSGGEPGPPSHDRRSLDRIHDRLAHCVTYLEAARQAAAEALPVTAALRLGLDNVNPLDLVLVDLTDVDLYRRTLQYAHRISGKLEPAESDELFELLDEIFERFAPAADRALAREDCGDDEYLGHCAFLARRDFRRRYGVDFEELVRKTELLPSA
jgi:hypothetical protein